MSYQGTVVFEELDERERSVRLVGKGREKSGSGSAEMTMHSRVLPRDGGGSEVTVDSEIRLTGKIVRFGRGMIEAVSGEILEEFRTRLAEQLSREAEADAATGESGAAGVAGVGAGGPTTGSDDADRDGLRLIPLLLRALRSWLGRLFKRA